MEIFDLAEVFGAEFLDHPPVAAYVPKTITVDARAGNPPPRILETPAGMINAIGLSGEGLEAFVRRPPSAPARAPVPADPERRRVLARGIRHARHGPPRRSAEAALGDRWPAKAGLELNISCPNVHTGCVSIGSDPGETEAGGRCRQKGVARPPRGQAHSERHRHRRHRAGRRERRAPMPSRR